MNGILDRVARSSSAFPHNQFRPSSPLECFALRLSQKLGEPATARHFVQLAERYGEGSLLVAFRRARSNSTSANIARIFHTELERLGSRNGNTVHHRRLAAIRIERRAVAVVIMVGEHLEYPPLVRQLSSTNDKAATSAAGFISRILEKCPFETAAIENVPGSHEIQRSALTEAICQRLAERSVSIWKIPKRDILEAFGYPRLRFRHQLRKTISDIWPEFRQDAGSPLILDALGLGLYCQIEYLFNI